MNAIFLRGIVQYRLQLYKHCGLYSNSNHRTRIGRLKRIRADFSCTYPPESARSTSSTFDFGQRTNSCGPSSRDHYLLRRRSILQPGKRLWYIVQRLGETGDDVAHIGVNRDHTDQTNSKFKLSTKPHKGTRRKSVPLCGFVDDDLLGMALCLCHSLRTILDCR